MALTIVCCVLCCAVLCFDVLAARFLAHIGSARGCGSACRHDQAFCISVRGQATYHITGTDTQAASASVCRRRGPAHDYRALELTTYIISRVSRVQLCILDIEMAGLKILRFDPLPCRKSTRRRTWRCRRRRAWRRRGFDARTPQVLPRSAIQIWRSRS